MSDTAILFAYGLISSLVLVGYSWLARDIKKTIKQLGLIRQSMAWEKKRQLQVLRITEAKSEIPFIRPKGKGKTYKTWSRKGSCPGCNVSTGSNHHNDCLVRKNLLKQI